MKQSKINYEYYRKQFLRPYESTIEFSKWIKELKFLEDKKNLTVLDVGCGMGETLAFMSKKFKHVDFVGIDKNINLVNEGKKNNKKLQNKKIKLCAKNLFTFKSKKKWDLIVSIATFSWISNFQKALKKLAALNTKKIAFTSLMYDGPVECIIKVEDFSDVSRKTIRGNYNIYSIPKTIHLMRELGFRKFYYKAFHIKKKLIKKTVGLGTFTRSMKNGSYLQQSGPLLMPWYFFAAKK